jgi:hypothetical protein
MQSQTRAPLADNISTASHVYGEIIELIATGGGPATIIAFRPSAAMHDRVYELIERKRDGNLTREEADEMSHYIELEHIVRMAKIRARFIAENQTAVRPDVA